VAEYQKKRVLFGAIGTADRVCVCIKELAVKLPTSPELFVLVPNEQSVAKFQKAAVKVLTAPLRQWAYLTWRSNPANSPNAMPATSNGWLTADLVTQFETWVDGRSARKLKHHLDGGQSVMFVQVSNAAQEAGAYRIVSRYCDGVQLQDLPA